MVTMIAGALLCLGCTLCAVAVKRRYAAKREFAAEICTFIAGAKSDVRFLKTPLLELLECYPAGKSEGKKRFCEVLREVAECKRKGVPVAVKCDLLKPDEERELNRFFQGLGKTDSAMTLDSLARYGEYFEGLLAAKTDESKRLGDTYFKLLIILGLALLVIVV